jgi:hypothetical protein
VCKRSVRLQSCAVAVEERGGRLRYDRWRCEEQPGSRGEDEVAPPGRGRVRETSPPAAIFQNLIVPRASLDEKPSQKTAAADKTTPAGVKHAPPRRRRRQPIRVASARPELVRSEHDCCFTGERGCCRLSHNATSRRFSFSRKSAFLPGALSSSHVDTPIVHCPPRPIVHWLVTVVAQLVLLQAPSSALLCRSCTHTLLRNANGNAPRSFLSKKKQAFSFLIDQEKWSPKFTEVFFGFW